MPNLNRHHVKQFLLEFRKPLTDKTLYTKLLTSGRLNTYLDDINEQATEQMLLLIKQMAEREGVTEQLKAQDQMLWVQRMNNIRDRAIEIVNHSLIYA